MDLKVLTLNCWGIRIPVFGSKDLHPRIEKIAEQLNVGGYDLVALQEIWSEHDYDTIRTAVKGTLPYAHYFHSRHMIVTALMHRYSLNGFAHHVHRGDWFGGKVVGLVRVHVYPLATTPGAERHPFIVHLYTTHIHAEYNRDNDLYLSHRLVQAYELSQFVRHTSVSADLSILMGDLNLEPIDLGYRLVLANAALSDAWATVTHGHEQKDSLSCPEGKTCNVPDNKYFDTHEGLRYPNGKRIDYILYRTNSQTVVDVRTCEPRLNRIPSLPEHCYSDHLAVFAHFTLRKLDPNAPATISPSLSHVAKDGDDELGVHGTALEPMLAEALHHIEEGVGRVRTDRHIFLASLALLIFIFIYTIDIELTFPTMAFLAITIRFVITVIISFCLWYGLIGLKMEEKALKASREGMTLMLHRSAASCLH